MLQRRTKLTAHKRLNHISPRRVAELNAQKDIRIALCKRAGGKPIVTTKTFRINSKDYPAELVLCRNGICECGCGQYGEILTPHEKKTRGSGGKISLDNSLMVRLDCHKRIQKSNPVWSSTPSDNTTLLNQQGEVLPDEQ